MFHRFLRKLASRVNNITSSSVLLNAIQAI